jgi:hypothetical protein
MCKFYSGLMKELKLFYRAYILTCIKLSQKKN